MKTFTFKSTIWLYPGELGNWHFVSLPKELAKKIDKSRKGMKRVGWGSVKVSAKIRKTDWQTSIFPDKKSETYILPIKTSIRKAESLFKDNGVRISLTLV